MLQKVLSSMSKCKAGKLACLPLVLPALQGAGVFVLLAAAVVPGVSPMPVPVAFQAAALDPADELLLHGAHTLQQKQQQHLELMSWCVHCWAADCLLWKEDCSRAAVKG
jgi:hypothetical protein